MELAFVHKLKEYQPDVVLVVCDENTALCCFPRYAQVMETEVKFQMLVLPSGEDNKTLHHCERIWSELISVSASRRSILVALGGGLICDLTAFAASVYKRGIRSFLLPSTLLAMTDASVGGKTGVNFKGLKNMIGSFYSSAVILADLHFLETLPPDELLSGQAELLKHALLKDHVAFKDFVMTPMNSYTVDGIAASMKFKLQICELDFRDEGLREVLNLGHTSAHAIEALYLAKNQTLLHGFAVAAGLWIESIISDHLYGEAAKPWSQALRDYISASFPKLNITAGDFDFLITAMRQDKKQRGKLCVFTLLKQPGDAQTQVELSDEVIVSSLEMYVSHA